MTDQLLNVWPSSPYVSRYNTVLRPKTPATDLSNIDAQNRINLMTSTANLSTASEIFAVFQKPIDQYLFVEIDFLAMHPAVATNELDVRLYTTYNAIVPKLLPTTGEIPAASTTVLVSNAGIRTYRFPYVGPIVAFGFNNYRKNFPVQVGEVRVYTNPARLVTVIAPEIIEDSANCASVLIDGAVRYDNGLWDLSIPAATTVAGSIKFTSDGTLFSNGFVRFSRQQEANLADFRISLTDQPALLQPIVLQGAYAELWVDSQFLEIPVEIENTSTDQELSIQFQLELFRAVAPTNAFGVSA